MEGLTFSVTRTSAATGPLSHKSCRPSPTARPRLSEKYKIRNRAHFTIARLWSPRVSALDPERRGAVKRRYPVVTR